MKHQIITVVLLICSVTLSAQINSSHSKDRLDFAKSYFEFGGNYTPSFSGKRYLGNEVEEILHSPSINPYLKWGGFHFWGHGEFFISVPLGQFNLREYGDRTHSLSASVVTGTRFLPWKYNGRGFKPFLGLSWSAQDFKQILDPDVDYPTLSKNFMIVPEVGCLYGMNDFALNLSFNYFPNKKWTYPISRDQHREIKTPGINLQLGLRYAFESSKTKNEEQNIKWNSYPRVSRLGEETSKKGDFFLGAGPSSSFSLSRSGYTQANFPYLDDRLVSSLFLDLTMGYQFNHLGLFSCLSFRNPQFENSGYEANQSIRKVSASVEVNKFLKDYSGFVPFVGLNASYDRIQYSEIGDQSSINVVNNRIEPGVTMGWDILPGKTDEFLILRTNLRWYPFSSFDIQGNTFDFSQLEYNLIQVIFYPERFMGSRKRIR